MSNPSSDSPHNSQSLEKQFKHLDSNNDPSITHFPVSSNSTKLTKNVIPHQVSLVCTQDQMNLFKRKHRAVKQIDFGILRIR